MDPQIPENIVASDNQTNFSVIKKIPAGLRRKKFNPESSSPWYRKMYGRLKNDSQVLRSTVQSAFVLLWCGAVIFTGAAWLDLSSQNTPLLLVFTDPNDPSESMRTGVH